jgi:hypothetical protein
MVVILNRGARRLSRNPENVLGRIAEFFAAAGMHPNILAPASKDLTETVRRTTAGAEESGRGSSTSSFREKAE